MQIKSWRLFLLSYLVVCFVPAVSCQVQCLNHKCHTTCWIPQNNWAFSEDRSTGIAKLIPSQELSCLVLWSPKWWRPWIKMLQVEWNPRTTPKRYHKIPYFYCYAVRILISTDRPESFLPSWSFVMDLGFISSSNWYSFVSQTQVGKGGKSSAEWVPRLQRTVITQVCVSWNKGAQKFLPLVGDCWFPPTVKHHLPSGPFHIVPPRQLLLSAFS